LYWGQQLADAAYPAGAADIFRYVLHVEPTQLAAWHALGLCHLELDDFETAARLFELASEMGQRAAFLQLAAQAWFAAGDAERGTVALLAVWEVTQ
jgi:tetratricopeptide (TPR) repeat protein